MKQLGLISIVWVWCGLIFLIRKWRGNVSMTFSQHAAQTRASQIYYFLLFAIEIPLFALFTFKWFIPTYGLGFWFVMLSVLAMIGQFIAVVVPETKGRRVLIHRYAAFLMSDCLALMNIVLALNTQLSVTARIVAALMALFQIIVILILFERRAYHPKILPLQASYIAAFHISILIATYLG